MLTINNLSISLKEGSLEKQIIQDVSFSLKPGESLGIVGESGSGKTITALSILQLLPPGMRISGGEILLDNPKINLAALCEKRMQAYRGRVISMVFQEPMTCLNPSMRCGDQISESSRLHTDLSLARAKEKVSSLLKEVHLPVDPEFYRKYPHQLSGGQRQRIMIAMALAGNPEILIADEPTTALDVTVQKKILELLQEIRQNRQMSILFISHDLGVIRKVCENTLVMYKGEIVESGKVSKLFQNPGHPYTRGLLACQPGIKTGSKNRENNAPLLKVSSLMVEYSLKKNILGKNVKTLRAVDNISFHIASGETLGIIGESGCGKSTLGKSLIRLIRSGEGDIHYRDTDVSSLKGKKLNSFRQKVQYLFQDPYSSLNPRIAAGPSIMEVMKVHGLHPNKKERKNATLDILERVGLAQEHFERYPHEFSGGQRQRIGLARALATNPELIICDESVSSLDVSVQAMILNLLNDLKDRYNLTYLFISHDLSVVRHMSDRILVMKDGKLVEQGSGEQIFTDPSSDYTKELIDSILDIPPLNNPDQT